MSHTLIQKLLIWVIPLIFAITLHEVAHGYVASLFGDQTARFSGRLSLNPIKHVDVIGTVLIPLFLIVFGSPFIFGWAKPVPVDPRNLRHPRRDMALVALAGPLSNILMAIVWGLIGMWGVALEKSGNGWAGVPLSYMGVAGIVMNVSLALLNLLPIPPLDGGKVVESLVTRRASYYFHRIEPYGFLILILLLATGILNLILVPLFNISISFMMGMFGLG